MSLLISSLISLLIPLFNSLIKFLIKFLVNSLIKFLIKFLIEFPYYLFRFVTARSQHTCHLFFLLLLSDRFPVRVRSTRTQYAYPVRVRSTRTQYAYPAQFPRSISLNNFLISIS